VRPAIAAELHPDGYEQVRPEEMLRVSDTRPGSLKGRGHEAPILDALPAAHCTQVPLASACPLFLRELAGMPHCRRG
jgi:hypothetical protein